MKETILRRKLHFESLGLIVYLFKHVHRVRKMIKSLQFVKMTPNFDNARISRISLLIGLLRSDVSLKTVCIEICI